ncbi:MAG: glycine--tRNA ligase [Puniceicoccales bacterium]|jgi:glycyl-tRNA synthetase|nr:glycine--tRNA ligase [Puniceicoccales bacterium]
MDAILSLCKRRGFVFPSSEIYGGIGGFFDYGPLGCELKKNIKNLWWREMVQLRENVVGLDCSIIMNGKVWEASGHVDGFSDPLVDCRESGMRYRADQLFFSPVSIGGELIGYVALMDGPQLESDARTEAEKLAKKHSRQGKLDPLQLKPIAEATGEELSLIPSPATGTIGTLTAPRSFNLMFRTAVGALSDASATTYLRPETAQGIFVNFQNVLSSSRLKVPFGIAQIGKAFRNEITPRNFLFRSREFEQMELEYFIEPDADWQTIHGEWIESRLSWYRSIGIGDKFLGLDVHPKEKLAHYSRACSDITFRYPFGVSEMEGIAARGDFDLTCHQKCSGKSLEYFDEESKRHYLPHVIEPSAGVDRVFLAVLCAAYGEDELGGEKRTLLRLSPKLAPVKVAVFPLLKNRGELVNLSRKIFVDLRRRWNCVWDSSGAIGRRYRRMDEIGTPLAVTVDFESLETETVTLRFRDSGEQLRVAIEELEDAIGEQLDDNR